MKNKDLEKAKMKIERDTDCEKWILRGIGIIVALPLIFELLKVSVQG